MDPDRDDAARLRRGDTAGLTGLMGRHQDRLFRYLLRLVGDEAVAEDTFQQTWVQVAEHYAVPLEEAHEAAADARAAGRVAHALARRYRDALPSTARAVHVEQIAWARDQAASLTEYFVRIGRIDPAEPVDGTWPVR